MSSVAEDAGTDAVAELPREVWALIGANAVIALGYGMVVGALCDLRTASDDGASMRRDHG